MACSDFSFRLHGLRYPIALLLAATAWCTTAHGNDQDLKDWILGPIRYIAQPEERKAFRTLSDEGERALFIERFWIRRDPTPDTLVNEYRQLFWERVREVNDMIQNTPGPGWKN